VIYSVLFRLFLTRIDPELAHRLASRALRTAAKVPGAAAILRWAYCRRNPALETQAFGVRFPSPLGVAAGVDKDASWFEVLGLLGFGYVEVGTVTAKPQDGNPRPRVFRLTPDRAVLNKMGFPNPGAAVVAERLSEKSGRALVGVNVGKSMAVAIADAAPDYRQCVREVASHADYLVVNVSSPNTPGLTDMQAADLLRPLLLAVKDELTACHTVVPLLIKIGPDTSDTDIVGLARLAVDMGIDGIVAVNTTANRSGLTHVASIEQVQGGGVSGAPLAGRATAVLRLLYKEVGDTLPLISVGGVLTADDAWKRVLAGATLLQAHTGFIYGGPGWAARVNRHLARETRRAGAKSIQDMVGSEHRHGQAGDDGPVVQEIEADSRPAPTPRSVGATH
jgi:dihydroorotate dehydrogenase